MASERTKVLHIITGLSVGGAETMLAKLLVYGGRHHPSLDQEVLSLMRPADAGERLAQIGAPVHTLGLRRGELTVGALGALRRITRKIAPDLILGWMYHGYLAASFAVCGTGRSVPVIWNVRHSLSDIRHERASTRMVLRLTAALSRGPEAIIYNSRVALNQYRGFGYRPRRALVIANGFDTEAFRPRPDAREKLLGTFGIGPDAAVVGMIARYHPMKDPGMLVRAVALARAARPNIHLLLVGQGMTSLPAAVAGELRALPAGRVTLAEQRSDIAEWLPGLDILALPSAWGEGFPNVLGEAMACGVPCVATLVGDSAWILGDAGRTVPPRNPDAMARAIIDLLNLSPADRHRLGEAARARVVEHFSIETISEDYAGLYRDVLAARHPRSGSVAQLARGGAA